MARPIWRIPPTALVGQVPQWKFLGENRRARRRMPSVELEPLAPAPDGTRFRPVADRRPRVPEPLPVKLLVVSDPRLPAGAGLERRLDAFYVGLLGFERRPHTA